MTPAILYARQIPRPGAECDSCQKQHERQRAFCQAMGWQILAEEIANCFGGTRSALQETLACNVITPLGLEEQHSAQGTRMPVTATP
jgi:hypothetical protein